MDSLQPVNQLPPSSRFLETRKLCGDEETRGEHEINATGSGSFSKSSSSSKVQIPSELLKKGYEIDVFETTDEDSEIGQRQYKDEEQYLLIESNSFVTPCSQTVDSSKLDFRFVSDGFLFDRDDEIKGLHEAFHRSLSPTSQPELVLISGLSGVGKTALANQFQPLVKSHDGYFIRGKFDQMNNPQPYAAFVSAFTELVGLILKRGQDVVEELKNLMLKNIGSDFQLLVATFPALTKIVETTQSGNVNALCAEVQSRFRNSVTKLIESIFSIESSPIVLVIDDLQWGDSGSLDLLESLVSNQKIKGFVMVGICRSNEVSFDHNFAATLRQLEDDEMTTISHIEVNSLSSESANDMVSHTLHLPKQLCKPLTNVLIAKTEGNALFFLQLLQKFYDDNILMHDSSRGIWTWDKEKLESEKCSNVVDLLSQKITELPDETQTVLMSAACLGAEFSLDILSEILLGCDVSSALQLSVQKKIIIYDKELKGYTFHHDRMQQAAYSLISEKEKSLVHITIGRRLLKTLRTKNMSTHIFLIVDQMIRGKSLLKDQIEKNEVAAICLAAGAKSIRSSAFMRASIYFWQGINLLEKRRSWRREYELTLELYSAAAETEFCNAKFETMDAAIEEVLDNARLPIDQVRVYSAKINSLVAGGELHKAIDVGLVALKLFGVKFPKKIRKAFILKEILKTKCMLYNKNKYDLLMLPDMKEPNIAAAMGLLNHLARSTFSTRVDLFPLIATRIVRLSLEHGLCTISALGFCAYGAVLLNLGEYDRAHYFSELALSVLNRYKEKGTQWLARVHTLVYGIVSSWKHPFRKSLDHLMEAEVKGIETGDVEFAVLASRHYCIHHFFSGIELSSIVQKLEHDIVEMERLKQMQCLLGGKIQLKMIKNFMEKSSNPLDFVSNSIIETQKNNSSFMGFYGLWRLILGYNFGNIEDAIAVSQMPEMKRGLLKFTVIAGVKYFYIALTLLEAARESKKKKRKYLSQLENAIKKLKKYSEISPNNCTNKYLLVKAEFAALQGEKYEDIVDKYERSIVVASSEGFIQEQALACERKSVFLRSRGDNEKATTYFEKAVDLYTKWGANGKIAHMLSIIQT